MYLSRLTLSRRDLRVIRDLGDVAQLHRTLMRAFPDTDVQSPRASFGVLYRIEDGDGLTVLVQSLVPPHWSALGDGYLVEHQTKGIAHFVDGLVSGRRFGFRLVANPSRKSAHQRHDDSPLRNSRRVGLLTDLERHDWLVARGERHGFVLDGAGPFDGMRIDRLPQMASKSSGIVVNAVRYEGRLRIVDHERFAAAVQHGLGPAKAYGCGLLSLAPL